MRRKESKLIFGNQSMFRKTTEGKAAAEKGPSLVYSLGPTGAVAVMLFPAKSKLASVSEETIFPRIGYYSGYH
jgi:hypothetical protein